MAKTGWCIDSIHDKCPVDFGSWAVLRCTCECHGDKEGE